MLKSKTWKIIGMLPLFVLVIIWFVYLIIIKDQATFLFTILIIIIGIFAYKFIGYCFKKEQEAKIQHEKEQEKINDEENYEKGEN